jgi:hypothetical protein
MLSFFGRNQDSAASSSSSSSENNQKTLGRVLNKLQAFVQAEGITFDPHFHDSSTTIFRDDEGGTWKNTEHFLRHVNSGIAYLKALDGWKTRHFKIDFGTDLSKWDISEINELAAFFSAFKEFPIQLTVDAGQLANLGADKLNAFLAAIKSTTMANIRIARPYTANKPDELGVSKENLILIQAAFPQAIIELAQYFGSSRKSVTDRLIYAEATAKIAVKSSQEQEQPQQEQQRSLSPTRR